MPIEVRRLDATVVSLWHWKHPGADRVGQHGAMTWKAAEPDPVPGPMIGEDRGILEGYLGWQRLTLLNVCAGLTAEQLAARPVPPSGLSLLG